MVATADGEVTLSWIDIVDNGALWAMRRIGGEWTEPVALGRRSLADPRRLVIDRHGHVTILRRSDSSDGQIQLRRIARGSRTWEPAFDVNADDRRSVASDEVLVLDDDDNPGVLWRVNSPPVHLAYTPPKSTLVGLDGQRRRSSAAPLLEEQPRTLYVTVPPDPTRVAPNQRNRTLTAPSLPRRKHLSGKSSDVCGKPRFNQCIFVPYFSFLFSPT
ncbi:MAG: hypothetical protein KF901_03790 [Myxococcales bacterium]|nr:hypothetical protein [Myxococcales bacterium]